MEKLHGRWEIGGKMVEWRVKREKRSRSDTYRFADPNETGRKRASIAGVQPEGVEIWPRRVFPPVSRGFPIFPGRNVGRWVGSLQTIRSKIFTANPISLLRHGSPRGVEAAVVAAVAALQTRGMAAACSRKPINLYVCPPISSSFAISPYGKIFYVVPTFICDRDFIFISALGLIRDRVIRVWAQPLRLFLSLSLSFYSSPFLSVHSSGSISVSVKPFETIWLNNRCWLCVLIELRVVWPV